MPHQFIPERPSPESASSQHLRLVSQFVAVNDLESTRRRWTVSPSVQAWVLVASWSRAELWNTGMLGLSTRSCVAQGHPLSGHCVLGSVLPGCLAQWVTTSLSRSWLNPCAQVYVCSSLWLLWAPGTATKKRRSFLRAEHVAQGLTCVQ